MITSV